MFARTPSLMGPVCWQARSCQWTGTTHLRHWLMAPRRGARKSAQLSSNHAAATPRKHDQQRYRTKGPGSVRRVRQDLLLWRSGGRRAVTPIAQAGVETHLARRSRMLFPWPPQSGTEEPFFVWPSAQRAVHSSRACLGLATCSIYVVKTHKLQLAGELQCTEEHGKG